MHQWLLVVDKHLVLEEVGIGVVELLAQVIVLYSTIFAAKVVVVTVATSVGADGQSLLQSGRRPALRLWCTRPQHLRLSTWVERAMTGRSN